MCFLFLRCELLLSHLNLVTWHRFSGTDLLFLLCLLWVTGHWLSVFMELQRAFG